MSRKDEITNKGPLSGNTRSKALNHSRRKWNLNLQKVEVKDDLKGTKKVYVSVRTIKRLRKENKLV